MLENLALTFAAAILLSIGVKQSVVQEWAVWVVIGCGGGGLTIIYAFLRSGYSERWQKPNLAYPQLINACSAVVISFALIEMAQSVAMPLLCLLLVSEIDRIKTNVLWRASLLVVCALIFITAFHQILPSNQASIGEAVYNLIVAAVMLPLAIIIGSEVNRQHTLFSKQKLRLDSTLTRMRNLAMHDSLTGLINRRQAVSIVELERQRQQRTQEPFTLAVLDIDWFKKVNDRHGHAVGDKVLQKFSEIIVESIASTDTIARWGGEEFLLIMPNSKIADSVNVIDQIRHQMDRYDWAQYASNLSVKFSAGIASHAIGDSIQTALARADQALYSAKSAGRNCTKHQDLQHQTSVSGQLRNAFIRKFPSTAAMPSPAKPESTTQTLAQSKNDHAVKQPNNSTNAATASGFWNKIYNWVMSDDPAIREHLRLPAMGTLLHGFWIIVALVWAIPFGHVSIHSGIIIAVWELASMIGFYSAIRSGWSKRFKDPGLVLPNMLAGCVIIAFAYLAAPTTRTSLLHLLCVIQIFGMSTFKPKESVIIGIVGLLSIAVMWMGVEQGSAITETKRALTLLMTAFVVFRISAISLRYANLRQQMNVERDQLSVAMKQLENLVERDPLTDLYNRRFMNEALSQELQRSQRTQTPFCVALIDIDHFKIINDTYGHQTGDSVLQDFAITATYSLRNTDVICRWGGEEFLVLMRDTHPLKNGMPALARLRSGLASRQSANGTPQLQIKFSAGLVVSNFNETVDQLIERADQALYAAKAAGRNRDVIGPNAIAA